MFDINELNPDDKNTILLKSKFESDFEQIFIKEFIGNVSYHPETKMPVTRNTVFGKTYVKMIEGKYFSNPCHRLIIRLIKEFYEKRMDIPDYQILKVQLGDIKFNEEDYQYVEDTKIELIALYKLNVNASKSSFVRDKVIEFIDFQHAKETNIQAARMLENGELKNQKEFIDFILSSTKKTEVVDNMSDFSDVNNINLLNKQRYITSLGWGEDFDNILRPSQNSVVVGIAGTGAGKTTSAAITAVNAIKTGRKALFLFFEDDKEEVYAKMMANALNKSIDEVNNPKNKSAIEAAYKRFLKKYESKGGKVIFGRLSMTKTTTNDIRMKIQNFEDKYGKLELLILDYLDIVKAPKTERFSDEYKEQAWVMKDVIEICSEEEYDLCILTYIQAGRGKGLTDALTKDDAGGSYDRIRVSKQLFAMTMLIDGTFEVSIEKNRKGGRYVFKNCKIDHANVKLEIKTSNVTEAEAEILNTKFDHIDVSENADMADWLQLE